MTKFDKPHRLKNFSYSSRVSYLITFNTVKGEACLSEIIDRGLFSVPEVRLKPWGCVTEKYILNISKVYPDVFFENYVIMPTHVHILLTLKQVAAGQRPSDISKVIRATKAMITREIGQQIWQLDFYDVVADTEAIFQRCNEYIDNNPAEWLINHGKEPQSPK